MTLLILDDRRLAFAAPDGPGDVRPVAFTALVRSFGVEALDAATRRALVRRIAREPAAGIPSSVAASRGFAEAAVAALDSQDDALSPSFIGRYTAALAKGGVLDAPMFWASAREPRETLPSLKIDATLLGTIPPWLARLCEVTLFDAGAMPEPVADAPRAIAAIRSLLRFLDRGTDDELRAFALSPLSPLRNADARALAVAAARDSSFVQTIASNRVVLNPAGREMLIALREGLASVERAHRAPDATATSTMAAIVLAFDLRERTTAATVGALEAVCTAFDRACAVLGTDWRANELAAEIDVAVTCIEPPAPPAPELLLEPRDALDQRPVTVRRATFSASSLNAYVECARKWYFRYVCAAVEDPGGVASTYGRAFHSALEDFHTHYPRPSDVSEDILSRALRGYLTAAFDCRDVRHALKPGSAATRKSE